MGCRELGCFTGCHHKVTVDLSGCLLGAQSLVAEDHCSNPSFFVLLAFLLVCRSLSADKLQGLPKPGERHLEYFPGEECGKAAWVGLHFVVRWSTRRQRKTEAQCSSRVQRGGAWLRLGSSAALLPRVGSR